MHTAEHSTLRHPYLNLFIVSSNGSLDSLQKDLPFPVTIYLLTVQFLCQTPLELVHELVLQLKLIDNGLPALLFEQVYLVVQIETILGLVGSYLLSYYAL